MGPRIELHIDELVLHGVAFDQRHDVAEALRASLAEALAARGVPEAWAAGMAIDRLDAGAVPRVPESTPASFGAAVGGAIDSAFRVR